jgi:hypothetical protein
MTFMIVGAAVMVVGVLSLIAGVWRTSRPWIHPEAERAMLEDEAWKEITGQYRDEERP